MYEENIARQRQLADEILTLNQGGFTDAPDDDACDRVMASAVELAGLVLALERVLTVPLGAMRSIVDYNWDDEAHDYRVQVDEGNIEPDDPAAGHVFLPLQVVDAFLNEQGVE